MGDPLDFPHALVRWSTWRRRLRRHRIRVPLFMTPWLAATPTEEN